MKSTLVVIVERWLSYKGTCHVILLAKLHDMYLYKTDNFFHINHYLKSVSKVALLHRFYCTVEPQPSLSLVFYLLFNINSYIMEGWKALCNVVLYSHELNGLHLDLNPGTSWFEVGSANHYGMLRKDKHAQTWLSRAQRSENI